MGFSLQNWRQFPLPLKTVLILPLNSVDGSAQHSLHFLTFTSQLCEHGEWMHLSSFLPIICYIYPDCDLSPTEQGLPLMRCSRRGKEKGTQSSRIFRSHCGMIQNCFSLPRIGLIKEMKYLCFYRSSAYIFPFLIILFSYSTIPNI